MATILHLVEQNQLHKLDPGLSWREQEERMIFVFPKVSQWMTEVLPNEASNWNLEQTPIEQLAAFAADFCSGEELVVERQVRAIRHVRDGIWELKTADIRMFGWFVKRDCFICTAANTTLNVKEYRLYTAYADEALRIRDRLDLDEPKHVPGDCPNDVLSAWCYPPP